MRSCGPVFLLGSGNAVGDTVDGIKEIAGLFSPASIQKIFNDPVGTLEKGYYSTINMPKYIWNAVKTAWDRDFVHGNAESRTAFITYGLTSIGISILGDKGISKIGNIAKLGNMAAKSAEYIPKIHNSPEVALAGVSDVSKPVPYNVLDDHELLTQINTEVDEVFRSSKGVNNTDRLISGNPGVVTGGDSTKLGKNMMKQMGLKRSTKWSGYQAQHIIPSEMANNPVIKKIGMNLDDASNGIFLRVPDNDISSISRHRGYHSVYNEVVERALNKMDINQSVDSLQKKVFVLQQNLRKLQEKGLPLYPSQGATVDLWERKLKQSEN